MDWPDEGEFQICVTAVIGNLNNGSICDQEGPVCATVRVRKIESASSERTLCFENTPYSWHGKLVTALGGEYKHTFNDRLTCCEFDSVINFIVLDKVDPFDAGIDFRKQGLKSKLKANSKPIGSWNLISGPGTAYIDSLKNRETNIRVNRYGKYCFEWSSMLSYCTIRDTVCVDFFKYIAHPPDTPKKEIEVRAINSKNTNSIKPKFIHKSDHIEIELDASIKGLVEWAWVDPMGRRVMNSRVQISEASSSFRINLPTNSGWYFLQLEYNDLVFTHRILIP